MALIHVTLVLVLVVYIGSIFLPSEFFYPFALTATAITVLKKLYVNLLLRLFEYGSAQISSADYKKMMKKMKRARTVSELEDVCSETTKVRHLSSSISREEKPLVPDGDHVLRQRSTSSCSEEESQVNHKLQRFPSMTSTTSIQSTDSDSSFSDICCDDELDREEFALDTVFPYLRSGMEAVIEDEVTKCFNAQELPSWNMLTRTNTGYEFISIKLTIIWILGFFFRYVLLLPTRFLIFLIGAVSFVVGNTFVSLLPEYLFKKWWNRHVSLCSFSIWTTSMSTLINIHFPENRPLSNGICVANHTTPVDTVFLASDNVYTLTGQWQPGVLQFFQSIIGKAGSHLWFDRGEMRDRTLVKQRLRTHTDTEGSLPVLMFPEGVCINNSAVFQFSKGSFEAGADIYPIAMKYDLRFGDPFWGEFGFFMHLLRMWSSWAIVLNVHYLPMMRINDFETPIQFADRVKTTIAHSIGLQDLKWNGFVKVGTLKKEWKEKQQEGFSKIIF